MADYFVDHGAYASALGTTPTWGVPQEGDGTSKDAAPSSSIATITFSGVPSSGAISLCGASVSTTGVIGAASASAAATALAANINSTTGAVSTTFCNSGTPTNVSRLQNIVYARVNPGDPTQVQVMTRVGSSALNVTCWGSTLNNASVAEFSGGVGGCWGWFINPSAIGVSGGIAALSYGVFLTKQTVGFPSVTDTIWCRTGGGASKTIAISHAATATVSHAGISKSIVFDTNTQWTSDSSTGVLKIIDSSSTWNALLTITTTADGQNNTYRALRLGGFEVEAVVSNGARLAIGGASYTGGLSLNRFVNTVFRDSGDSSGYLILSSHPNGTYNYSYLDCMYLVTTPRSVILAPTEGFFKLSVYSSNGRMEYRGCVFDFNVAGVSDPGSLTLTTNQTETELVLHGCEFRGFSTGYTLMSSAVASAWAAATARLRIVVDNCSGLRMPATYAGLPTATKHRSQYLHQLVFSNANLSTQAGLRLEDNRGVVEWVPDDPTPFPYLGSTLAGSGIPYALRLLWIRSVGLTEAMTFESMPVRVFTQLSAAVRSVTQKIFCPSITSKNVLLCVSYTDSSGVSRTQFSDVLASDGSVWNNAGSYSGFAAKKIDITTEYAVKANSEIVATIIFNGPPPGSDAVVPVYVDPELTVT